jgi:4'-phosphopantetheinyl transferase
VEKYEAHLYTLPLEVEPEYLQNLAQLLSPDELKRANRFIFEKDRKHFIAARGRMRQVLSGYCGENPAELIFDYASNGKPYLPRHRQLHFNLAHSGELAVLGITGSGRIGVDVELTEAKIDLLALARRFFAPPEVAALIALPESQQKEAFYNCWTRKEAYIKALGTGLATPLDSFCVSLFPGEPAELLAVNGSQEQAAGWYMVAFSPAPGYAAAVCLEERRDWQLTFFTT